MINGNSTNFRPSQQQQKSKALQVKQNGNKPGFGALWHHTENLLNSPYTPKKLVEPLKNYFIESANRSKAIDIAILPNLKPAKTGLLGHVIVMDHMSLLNPSEYVKNKKGFLAKTLANIEMMSFDWTQEIKGQSFILANNIKDKYFIKEPTHHLNFIEKKAIEHFSEALNKPYIPKLDTWM